VKREGDQACSDLTLRVDALGNEDQGVRLEAVVHLGELRYAQAVEPLVVVLACDEDADVRLEAAWALGQLGDAGAVEPLVGALRDENEDVRVVAARVLGEAGLLHWLLFHRVSLSFLMDY
jgi:HEAT repeat protein